jgi:hypothetical protein
MMEVYEVKVYVQEPDFQAVFDTHYFYNIEEATNKFYELSDSISSAKSAIGNFDYRLITQEEINEFLEDPNDDEWYKNKGITSQGIIEWKESMIAYYFIDFENYETVIGDYAVLRIKLEKLIFE